MGGLCICEPFYIDSAEHSNIETNDRISHRFSKCIFWNISFKQFISEFLTKKIILFNESTDLRPIMLARSA
jgi:hypothetical protein